jgi:hypothetical protein
MAKPPPSGPEGDSGPDANPGKPTKAIRPAAKRSTKKGAERASADGVAST